MNGWIVTGNKTTPSPSWKLGFRNSSSLEPNFSMNASVSARKIGANLWQVLPQFNSNKIHQQRHYEKQISDQLNEEEPSDRDSQPVTPSVNTSRLVDRICNLEQQHLRNTVLMKSLKRDIDISRAQIKTLVEERKQSELLDLLMRERKTRALVENLCDEFAKELRGYEQKLRFLQPEKHQGDGLTLHASKAWLDERVQMKSDISDNLRCEIETFLEVKKKQSEWCEPSSQSETCLKSISRMPCSGGGASTLMAKLVEARLESQFSKSTRVRRKVV